MVRENLLQDPQVGDTCITHRLDGNLILLFREVHEHKCV